MPNDKIARLAVYDPPKPDLPFIAVVIYPDGKVTGIAAPDAATAQELLEEIVQRVEEGNR